MRVSHTHLHPSTESPQTHTQHQPQPPHTHDFLPSQHFHHAFVQCQLPHHVPQYLPANSDEQRFPFAYKMRTPQTILSEVVEDSGAPHFSEIGHLSSANAATTVLRGMPRAGAGARRRARGNTHDRQELTRRYHCA